MGDACFRFCQHKHPSQTQPPCVLPVEHLEGKAAAAGGSVGLAVAAALIKGCEKERLISEMKFKTAYHALFHLYACEGNLKTVYEWWTLLLTLNSFRLIGDYKQN